MINQTLRAPGFAIAGLFLGSGAFGQQFTFQNGLIPGTPRWTEGVEAVDVDQDGDLDLCFADGDGFASAGTQRQQVLLINQLVPSGSLGFVDESVARLGVQLANGKGVTTGDVNGDGWVDLLYVSAFNNDVPLLYINRGAAQPGFFDLESSTRGFTENLSSGGAQFGDLDDDGDLDVIICDSGASYLGGAGARPRLFLNDGAGFFSEDAASLNAPIKRAHQDVHLVDLDGDWDVDFVGLNRATNAGGNHYVMLNDGTGSFLDVSNLLPNTSGLVYEAELADLDGDDDVDLYFVSVSGFSEGPIRNTIDTGSLGFSTAGVQNNSIDDNEIALMDFDNDGDLDSFIASLGNRERLAVNNGGLSYTMSNPSIQAISDSSLDMTVADLDNDGDYDLVTAQGESNQAQFANKVYLNSGPADSIAPTIVGVNVPTSSAAFPVVLKTKHTDSAMDDGKDYVTSTLFAAPANGAQMGTVFAGGFFLPSGLFLVSGDVVVFNSQAGDTTLTVISGPSNFSLDLAGGVNVNRAFVIPGTYVIQATDGSILNLVVTGSPTIVEGFPMGEGQRRFAVPQLPASPVDAFAAEIEFRDYAGNASYANLLSVDYPGGGGASNYCGPAVVNSSGQSAVISATGSLAVSAMNFGLAANSLPTNQFGFFLVSSVQGFTPNAGGSAGNLCLGGNVGRFNSQIMNSGAGGSFGISVNLNNLPTNPPQAVLPGQTWNFQAWFRDLGMSSNFTDGVSVLFQ